MAMTQLQHPVKTAEGSQHSSEASKRFIFVLVFTFLGFIRITRVDTEDDNMSKHVQQCPLVLFPYDLNVYLVNF